MALGLGRSSKNSSTSGGGWTPKQKAGQDGLNARLRAARCTPVEGREVPEQTRRSGRMDD
ncbi:hypothetical protein [Streptomyces monashensis]|uniref:Uncharacterized protein n=1 Tax=Streptomyces monashensis TaxID=1678012 RepID=A0A1S2QRG4_9ACTN|nr:hypothetical protein [Streptomyces monashensis]OIK08211.1 hypothetical protein BIV23_00235 [Streptomyces monashensis]